jgi:multicomponent Na+:H+ antiporter subunit C
VTGIYVYSAAGLAIFVIGLSGVVMRENITGKLIALNIAGSGIFLFLTAVAARGGEEAPDPVPHALVLTGVVVTVSVTALALAINNRMGGDSPERDTEDDTGQK